MKIGISFRQSPSEARLFDYIAVFWPIWYATFCPHKLQNSFTHMFYSLSFSLQSLFLHCSLNVYVMFPFRRDMSGGTGSRHSRTLIDSTTMMYFTRYSSSSMYLYWSALPPTFPYVPTPTTLKTCNHSLSVQITPSSSLHLAFSSWRCMLESFSTSQRPRIGVSISLLCLDKVWCSGSPLVYSMGT